MFIIEEYYAIEDQKLIVLHFSFIFFDDIHSKEVKRY